MNHHYEDIRSRIDQPPEWFDEHAVPRYCAFHPRECANIYAKQAALVEIACQNCGRRFLVAFSQAYPFDIRTGKQVPTLRESIADNTIHYGDPPNIACCASGPTMNSVPVRVIEYWEQVQFDWVRVPEMEVALRAPWMEDEHDEQFEHQ